MRIGFTEEASGIMNWLEVRCHDLNPDGALGIMYGINGNRNLVDETLLHVDSYQGSHPVRISNGAATELQLDIYGELLDSVYLYNKYGHPSRSKRGS